MLSYHVELIKVLNDLKPKIRQIIDSCSLEEADITYKSDNSMVTKVDIEISNLFKLHLRNIFPEVHFFSEEDHSILNYPTFILDPIDGTKEFVEGREDWVISFGLYFSDDLKDLRNYSWIYNPNNEYEVSSDSIINYGSIEKTLVSRTEFKAGLHTGAEVEAVGSIAYKLLLLCKGQATKVISKKPKSIWDIAAGTHILLKNNFKFEENGQSQSKIKKLYIPELIWSIEASNLKNA